MLNRTNAEAVCLMWLSQELYLSRVRLMRKEDARGSAHRVQRQVSYMFQSVGGFEWLVLETTIGSLIKAGWGNLQDEASRPCSIRNGIKNNLRRKES